MPINFLRHYYDIYKLLQHDRVLAFIGTEKYFEHKHKRFRKDDEKDLTKNSAFTFNERSTLDLYSNEFTRKSDLYFRAQPSFIEIINYIKPFLFHL